MAADPIFRVDGLSLFGAREFRTASSLSRRGLAYIDTVQRLWLTNLGRASIEPNQPGDGS
jgi:hypothetical protein